MFPHYIFMESENGERLRNELEEYRGFVTILEDQECLIPVKKEEKQFLQGVCGISHNLGMSKGYIQNGQTCVTEGPLQGREKLIRKIDRHKRLARLIIPGRNAFGDSNLEICAGLEIVSKS